jgi:hypothetical protein
MRIATQANTKVIAKNETRKILKPVSGSRFKSKGKVHYP